MNLTKEKKLRKKNISSDFAKTLKAIRQSYTPLHVVEVELLVSPLKQLADESNFKWISSNLTDEKGTPFAGVPQYTIKNLRGIKIGFIGLTDGMNTTGQDGKVFQQDIIHSAQSTVKLLKKEGEVDIIIALTQ